MRPLSLRLEGFTCYKQPTEITFEGLDLFAITGPTGSGKSSIVDGITYALYGRVPRLGTEVRSLISLGSERLQAAFEFAIDGDRYRVLRSTCRKSAARVQLFRFEKEKGEWEGLEDRAAAVFQKVRALLGLDYEGFIRSILLPQGQFHLFLAGEPKERYQVLDDLLRLDVYARIMQAANTRARAAEADIAALARRLAEDYADATVETLKSRKLELAALERSRHEIEEKRAALTEGRQAAEALRTAESARAEAARKLQAVRSALKTAESTLRGGSARVRTLDSRIKSIQQRIESVAYEPDVHQRLKLALTPAWELEKATFHAQTLTKQQAVATKAESDARTLVEGHRWRAEQATAALAEAVTLLESLQHREAATRLRAGLSVGDTCPVCGQPVALIPPGEHVALDKAQQERNAAAEAQRKAATALQMAERGLTRAEAGLESINREVAKAGEDVDRWRADLLERLDSQEPVAAAVIEKGIQEQDGAQRRAASLSQEKNTLEKQRVALQGDLRAAEAGLAHARAEVAVCDEAVARHEKEAAARHGALSTLAAKHAWDELRQALERGEDTVATIEARQSDVVRRATGIDQAIGAARADVKRIREGIAQAKELRAEEKTLRRSAEAAKQLANLLRADRFQAYVQRAALKALAEDASHHLRLISDNRYELDLEDLPESRDSAFRRESQEFVVIDHWGDQDKRSVKTLSGGETFLASLSLALALAERLPELGAVVRPPKLDSLFLDEGFGALDDDTLEAVASALDRLHLGGPASAPSGRMIGVITHRAELAERMPARILVVKSQDGSRVEQD